MKAWRRTRPFWGGVFIVVAGVELLSIPLAIDALPVAVMFGTVGAAYLIALIMILAGVLVWLQPGQRVFLGLIAVLLSMASFVYSNLGGFLVGMLLGLLGGMLAIAWTPVDAPAARVDTITVRTLLTATRTIAARSLLTATRTIAARNLFTGTRTIAARMRRTPAPTDTPPAAPKLREPAG
ncbi:MAG: hypothetical protein HOW71_03185 [Nonomuraea sp.]|nr:hypothetical protein [Nonomuraea sp.]